MIKRFIGYNKNEISKLCGHELNLENIHRRLLDMMVVFDSYCRSNKLTYYMADGTLLGAIRHKGFIPWDDDIDLYMPRKDYDILRKETAISNDLLIVTNEHPCGYDYPYTYINIVDKTTIMVANSINTCTGKGLSIDILPIDKVPNEDDGRIKLIQKIMKKRHELDLMQIRRKTTTKISEKGKKIIAFLLSNVIDETQLIKDIDHLASSYNMGETMSFSQLLLVKPLVFSRTMFSLPVDLEFEGYKFYGPADYDTYLKMRYGDYMTPPPENKRYNHDMRVFVNNTPDFFQKHEVLK